MRTELYWVTGPWSGRLAIMPRPRGGDWLEVEIQAWRQSAIDVILSLLTSDEVTDLGLADEADLSQANGIQFVSFPIADRGVPLSRVTFLDLVTKLAERLAVGKNIALHCRQGIGRSALVAICLLVLSGMELEAAIQQVGAARGCPVPETPEQRRWVADFTKSLMTQLPN